MIPKDYNDNFHEVHFQNSINSAKEVIPLFLSYYKPKTVLDVGCGLGTWLNIFEQNQCEVFGIDGDYIKTKDLVIKPNKFKAYDLNKKFNLEKKFDLVISLEVAEHILPENAKEFVESICVHSDVVLFSAAVPGQEGTLHYNEQYNKYWIDLFTNNNYECVDFLRHEIWNNKNISWWYRQNMLIFIKKSKINNPLYKLIIDKKREEQNSYIHPELLEYKCEKINFLEQRIINLEKKINSPSKLLKYYLKRLKSKIK